MLKAEAILENGAHEIQSDNLSWPGDWSTLIKNYKTTFYRVNVGVLVELRVEKKRKQKEKYLENISNLHVKYRLH